MIKETLLFIKKNYSVLIILLSAWLLIILTLPVGTSNAYVHSHDLYAHNSRLYNFLIRYDFYFRVLKLWIIVELILAPFAFVKNIRFNSFIKYVKQGARTFFIVIIAAEFICIIVYERDSKDPNMDGITGNVYINNPVAGWVTNPHCVNGGGLKVMRNGDTIYKVPYKLDSLGRRISENNAGAKGNKHAIFIGCSFTFGNGITEENTMAHLFHNERDDYNTYNYGVNGWGPHQTLHLFGSLHRISGNSIVGDSGICVYTYLDDHLARVYGGLNALATKSSSPDVYIEDGKLISGLRSGINFTILNALAHSALAKHFNIVYPKTYSDDFYKRFAAIVDYNAEEYYRIFPKGHFVVLLYPWNSKDTKWISYLKDARIKVVKMDDSIIPPPKNNDYWIPHDSHPKGKANAVVIKELIRQIKL